MINKRILLREAKNIYTKFSPTYYQTKKLLQMTEYLPEESLQAWQFRHLKKVLIHAYEKVPYYRRTFRQAGVDLHDMVELAQIQAFPFLTKEQYRDNIDEFISQGVRKALLMRSYTGGTTGTPMPVYRNLSDFAREKAFTEFVYRMLEMDPFCRSVYMRGEVDDKRGCYHYVGNFGKTLYLSNHNMSDKNLELYVRLIRDSGHRLLYTLPSAATVLAQYMERNHIAPFDGLRWVFCVSENLYEFQTKFIEEVLQCRVGSFYGHAEHAVMTGHCTKSTLHHVLPQYGYTELVGKDGKPIMEEGRLGEIVGTAFTNPCCPFIRYRTGDYAVYTKKKCPCGRNYQMWEKIEGRRQAMAVAKNGGRVTIGPALLCAIHDETYGKIRQFEIEQRRVGELTVHVVPYQDCDVVEIREYFERVFADQFPGSFDVKVELFEKLELSKTGKHQYFIQRIRRKDTIPDIYSG